MANLHYQTNETLNIAIYMQMMSAFTPGVDFRTFKQISLDTHNFLKSATDEEIVEKLADLTEMLTRMSELFIGRFPPKKDLQTIVNSWNDLFRDENEVLAYGVEYGWLEELMDLTNFRLYDHVPYHFKVGLGVHKGRFGIEEEFLLKDAFDALIKAQDCQEILIQFGRQKQLEQETRGGDEFDDETYREITYLKYEVSAHSRLSVISFYAFVESFVNSVGYSYLQRNAQSLDEQEKEILLGKRKGRFLQLRNKIERFQRIIRSDKSAVIITSDDGQVREPFMSFFDHYEALRNSSVHYSPLKNKIWLNPQEWLNNAEHFSEIATTVALEFWRACYVTYNDPEYLGKLDYQLHLKLAKERFDTVETIKSQVSERRKGLSHGL